MYYVFLNNICQTVNQDDDNEDGDIRYWHIGENIDFEFDQDDHVIIVKEYGCNCSKCGEFYPYAEAVENFKCWSCRNF